MQQLRAPLDFRVLDAVGTSLTPGFGPNPIVVNTWSDGGGVVVVVLLFLFLLFLLLFLFLLLSLSLLSLLSL